MDTVIRFTVNGQEHRITTDAKRPLLDVLREDLQLTGAKFGCGETRCGACSVLINGSRAFSCSTPMSTLQGKAVITIEGLCDGDKLHPVQQAFLEEGAFQCGYCTPGMIINTVALLSDKPNPNDEEIRDHMNTNLCRCCGYAKVTNAVKRAIAMGGAK